METPSVARNAGDPGVPLRISARLPSVAQFRRRRLYATSCDMIRLPRFRVTHTAGLTCDDGGHACNAALRARTLIK